MIKRILDLVLYKDVCLCIYICAHMCLSFYIYICFVSQNDKSAYGLMHGCDYACRVSKVGFPTKAHYCNKENKEE